jgi:predicted nucleic acid binding AN1-type Zn finger protein
MDWSVAVTPLDKGQVDEMARKAFHLMTGLNLDSFNVRTKIETEGLPKRSDSDNKIFSAKDVEYPFATFKYGDSNSVRVPFSGEMVQVSPGHGEFVSLLAIVSKTEAVYELGEKFIGHGAWESALVKKVNSMDTAQRGEVYRRLFVH